jgi:hypothetical protein
MVALIALVLAAFFCVTTANARVIMTLDQVGPDVVLTASGTINLADMTSIGGGFQNGIQPDGALAGTGNEATEVFISISGPSHFGSGGFTASSTGTGDSLAICGGCNPAFIGVPDGYMSGNQLSGTATFDNTTLAALGATPGHLYLDLGIRLEPRFVETRCHPRAIYVHDVGCWLAASDWRDQAKIFESLITPRSRRGCRMLAHVLSECDADLQ